MHRRFAELLRGASIAWWTVNVDLSADSAWATTGRRPDPVALLAWFRDRPGCNVWHCDACGGQGFRSGGLTALNSSMGVGVGSWLASAARQERLFCVVALQATREVWPLISNLGPIPYRANPEHPWLISSNAGFRGAASQSWPSLGLCCQVRPRLHIPSGRLQDLCNSLAASGAWCRHQHPSRISGARDPRRPLGLHAWRRLCSAGVFRGSSWRRGQQLLRSMLSVWWDQTPVHVG